MNDGMPNRLPVGAKSVVVFAPHPDDDVIGCGGSLSLLAGRLARCTIVYMTDGSKSHPNSRRFPGPVLAALRESEARNALTALGISAELIFLRYSDGTLGALSPADHRRAVDVVTRLLLRLEAEIVYSPWRRDVHSDHVATAEIVEEALDRLQVKPTLLMYPVWLTITGGASDAPRVGEVATLHQPLSKTQVSRKRAALSAHRSQTSDLIDDDPSGFVIGKRTLEAWTSPVETFFRPVGHDARYVGAPLV